MVLSLALYYHHLETLGKIHLVSPSLPKLRRPVRLEAGPATGEGSGSAGDGVWHRGGQWMCLEAGPGTGEGSGLSR